MKKLSFIIPVYNSEKTIADVVHEIISTTESLNFEHTFEIILINDGSKDNSYEICKNLSLKFQQVKTYTMTRNFGQASAVLAGFLIADGEYIICLDDDLQTPPQEYPKLLYKLISCDYDLVYGYYEQKKHSAFRNLGANMNGVMQNKVIKMPHDLHTSSYFVARNEIVKAVAEYKQPYPYLPGLFFRITHNLCSIPITHRSRQNGKSGYTLKKLLKLWIDGLLNFSLAPLKAITLGGLLLFVVSLILAVATIVLRISHPSRDYAQNTILIFILFLNSFQMVSIGFLGEYVGRMYMGMNGTPQYVLAKASQHLREEEVD